ncbi:MULTISPECIES: hypothetical protein [Xanthomonas]|nr:MULTISPECIES: hypothetical protein [Xanthomonas]
MFRIESDDMRWAANKTSGKDINYVAMYHIAQVPLICIGGQDSRNRLTP